MHNKSLLPRLAVRLRSSLPDAQIRFDGDSRINLRLPALNQRELVITARREEFNGSEPLFLIESSIELKFDTLQRASDHEILKLVASENQGLRGVTLEARIEGNVKTIRLRSSFAAFKGRSIDEAENILIDVLSIARFAKLLEDRIIRSSAGGIFCVEMHHSQYVSKSGTRLRYVNYARSVFQGSAERVFGEMCAILKSDYNCRLKLNDPLSATATKDSQQELQLRVPTENPIAVLTTKICEVSSSELAKFGGMLRKLNQLNLAIAFGHFEAALDHESGRYSITFVACKHLTNDVRIYSLDHALHAVAGAEARTRQLQSKPMLMLSAPAQSTSRDTLLVVRKTA